MLELSGTQLKKLRGLRSKDGPEAVQARKRLQSAIGALNVALAAAVQPWEVKEDTKDDGDTQAA